MVDSPGYGSSSVLDSFLFDGGPQSPSAHAHGAFLRIDDGIVEVAKEVDDKAATTNRNLEVVHPGVLQRATSFVSFTKATMPAGRSALTAHRAIRPELPGSSGVTMSPFKEGGGTVQTRTLAGLL